MTRSEIGISVGPVGCGDSRPALGRKTPRLAVKSSDGREAVEALLKDAERDRGQDPFMADANREGARRVRELLGLNGA